MAYINIDCSNEPADLIWSVSSLLSKESLHTVVSNGGKLNSWCDCTATQADLALRKLHMDSVKRKSTFEHVQKKSTYRSSCIYAMYPPGLCSFLHSIGLDKGRVSGKYFSYFSTKTYVVGTPQYMFSWRNKKNINTFGMKKVP